MSRAQLRGSCMTKMEVMGVAEKSCFWDIAGLVKETGKSKQ